MTCYVCRIRPEENDGPAFIRTFDPYKLFGVDEHSRWERISVLSLVSLFVSPASLMRTKMWSTRRVTRDLEAASSRGFFFTITPRVMQAEMPVRKRSSARSPVGRQKSMTLLVEKGKRT
jgi:hypothetical protein